MKTITINNPAILQNTKEFVLIPREEYRFLQRIKKEKIQEASLTVKQKKAVAWSEKELKKGEYYTLNELEKYMARPRAKTRC